MKSKVMRGWAIGAVALALLVVFLGFAPARAWARQLLAVFRVNRFVVVEVEPDAADMVVVEETVISWLKEREPVMVAEGDEVRVDSIEAARELAGFQALVPSYMPGEDPSRITVKGYTEAALPVGRDDLVLLLDLAGLDSSDVPDEIDEGQVRAVMPAMVSIENDRVTLVQMWQPELQYPDGVDAHQIAQAGLILMGMDAKDAERLSEYLDLGQTLLVPVPVQFASYQETVIAGADAVILRDETDAVDGPTVVLIWAKDGIVNLLTVKGAENRLVEVAGSMYQ